MLEISNIPTSLILYAVQQWNPCHKYAAKKGMGKNTNPFIKGISIWLLLKHETPSGSLQKYRSQLITLAAKCKVSVRTLDKWIDWLKEEDLLHVEGKTLMLHPYKNLKKYGLDIKERHQTILYDLSNKNTLADIITAIGMDLLKERPLDAYWKKMTKNQDALTEVRNHLIAFGADQHLLDEPEYFRQCHIDLLVKTYKEEKPGQSSFYLLHKHINANPDVNYKAATYAKKMGYSYLTKTNPVTKKDESVSIGFCHLKCRLSKKGLITVVKAQVESEYRARKDEAIFHHRYVKKSHKTIWFRPDQISINNEAIYKKKTAA